jgi:hypothetical protein
MRVFRTAKQEINFTPMCGSQHSSRHARRMRTPVIAKKKTGASTTDPDWLKSARVGGGNRLLLAPRRKGGVVHRKLIEGQNGYKVLAYEAENLELAAGGHWNKFKDWPPIQRRKESNPGKLHSVKEIDAELQKRFGNMNP